MAESSAVSTVTVGVGGTETGEMVRLEAQPLRLISVDGGRRYACDFVVAGRVKRRDGSPSSWVIAPEALEAAVDKFSGVAVFVDHEGFFDLGRKVRDLAGVTESALFADDRIEGTIRLYEEGAGAWASALFDQMLDDQALGREVPDVGLSAVFWHRATDVEDDYVTIEFTQVESVDVVFGPGAKGAVRAALQAVGADLRPQSGGGGSESLSPGNSGAIPGGGNEMGEENTAQKPVGAGDGAPPVAPAPAPVAVSTAPPVQPAAVSTAPPVQPLVADPFGGWTPEQAALLQQEQQRQMQLQLASCQTFLDTQLRLLSPELPQASLDMLRKEFQGRLFPAHELQAAIDGQRTLLAELHSAGVVRGMGQVRGMLNDVDQITLAYEKLMGLDVSEPVQPLTGIRELYLALTGDRQMRGEFNPEFATLQATTTTIMAEVTANVLNKVLLAQWLALGEVGYLWWERIAEVQEFTTLQQVKWITVDGFVDLLPVLEGGEYLEINWNDYAETSEWVKSGGYVGLTLEMIDTDDVGSWKMVPRGLATAGLRTLSLAVSALFTANAGTGPVLADGNNFFDAANHLNLITAPLDADNWDLAVQTMYAQQEQGSAKRLGIKPRFCLVPIGQEKKALQIFSSDVEPVSNVSYANVRATTRDNVITVPDWTDEDNWAAVADPVLAPAVGVGFRWGKVPELFSVTDPRMGLMFTHDTLPIKVRYLYTVGVVNYRGAVKSNV